MSIRRVRWTAFTVFALVAVTTLTGSVAARQPQGPEEIVFRSNRADDGFNNLYLIGRDGSNLRRLTFDRAGVRTPRISPDGTKIAFASTRAGSFDIWVIGRDGTGLTRVSTSPLFEDNPSWTEAGELVFARGAFGCPPPDGCVAVRTDLAGSEETLPIGRIDGAGLDASREGRILFTFDRAIWVADLDGSDRRRLTSPPDDQSDFRPHWAPKGQHFAFIRAGNAGNELWLGRRNEPAIQLTDTAERNEEYPSWSASGDEILFMGFFVSSPGRLYRISPDGSGDAEVSTTMHAPFLDTFSRDGRDGSVWHEVISGTEVTLAQTNGRVEISFGAGATEGGPFSHIEGHFGSRCTLPGDFDMQVDYETLDWPAANGTGAALQAFFANATVIRESSTWNEQYGAWLDGQFGNATTEQNAGSMRLVRRDGRFRGFWLYEGVWVPIRSAPANTTPVTFGLALMSFGGQFAHRAVRVAFDNFRLSSGEVSCPSWWASSFGDLG